MIDSKMPEGEERLAAQKLAAQAFIGESVTGRWAAPGVAGLTVGDLRQTQPPRATVVNGKLKIHAVYLY